MLLQCVKGEDLSLFSLSSVVEKIRLQFPRRDSIKGSEIKTWVWVTYQSKDH